MVLLNFKSLLAKWPPRGRAIEKHTRTVMALRESEKRFRDFAETAADWFWETDSEHRYTYISDRGPDIIGIAAEEMLGNPRSAIMDTENKPGASEDILAHQDDLDNHRPFRNFEYRVKHPDGEGAYLSVSGSPIFDADGTFTGYRGTARNITVRVIAEEQAKQAEERLRDAIESIRDGFILHDTDDRLVMCNSRYLEVYPEIADLCEPGVTFEEMLRANIERGGVPEAKGREEAFFNARLEAHRQCREADERNLADGRWTLASETRTKSGEIVGIRTNITDIIEREEALRKSEELFSKAFYASPLMMTIRDANDNRFLQANEAWLACLGFKKEDVIGTAPTNLPFWEPDDYSQFHEILKQDGFVRNFSAKIKGKSGKIFDLLISAEHIEFDGKPGILTVSNDITDRIKAEEEQKKSERRMRQLFENANDAIFIIDPINGRILDINEQAARHLGYSRDELLQLTVNDFNKQNLYGGYGGYAQRVFKTGHFLVDAEHVRKDGSIVPVEVSSRKVDHGDQQVVQSFVRDISERKRVEDAERKVRENKAQLAHVSRLSTTGEMASRLAHELNQPLSAISTHSNACARDIESGKAGREEILEDLKKISKQAIRAGEIIRWIRGFVRKQPQQKTELDINITIREVASFLNSEIQKNAIDLTVSLDEPLPCVNADKVQVQQVIMNLASNGIEALSKVDGPRSLTLGASHSDDGSIEISVEDNGPGISGGANDKIFEAFYTTKDKGTGLGLSISQTIVEDIGSKLECTSEPGKGAKFFFAISPMAYSEYGTVDQVR